MVPNCAYVMGARDQAVDRSGPLLNVLANVWTREYNSLPAMFFTNDLSHGLSSQNHVHVHHDAAPGKMTRAAVVPFLDPAVKPMPPPSFVLSSGGSLFPGSRNRGLLLSRDHLLCCGSVRVVFVWVVYLDPVTTVIRTVWSVEIATMFLNHEVHTLWSLVVSLDNQNGR